MFNSYLGVLGGTSGDFPWVQGEFLAPTFWAGRSVGRSVVVVVVVAAAAAAAAAAAVVVVVARAGEFRT